MMRRYEKYSAFLLVHVFVRTSENERHRKRLALFAGASIRDIYAIHSSHQ
jgi:hypothetical protein